MSEQLLTVVAAAIRLDDGTVYSLPAPKRHHDVIALIRSLGITEFVSSVDKQGFLLSDSRFARRKPSLLVAIKAGQVKEEECHAPAHGLFSEDVW